MTLGYRSESGQRAALASDVRVFIEGHLRNLARAGRLHELARSRDALAKCYRAQRNAAAVYVLANAPDFSLALAPDGGVTLTQPGEADPVVWTQSELVETEQDAVDEVRGRLPGNPAANLVALELGNAVQNHSPFIQPKLLAVKKRRHGCHRQASPRIKQVR